MWHRLILILQRAEDVVLAEAPRINFVLILNYRVRVLACSSDVGDFLLNNGRIFTLGWLNFPQEVINGRPIEVSDIFELVSLFRIFFNRFCALLLLLFLNLGLVGYGRLGSRRLLFLRLGCFLGFRFLLCPHEILVEVTATHLRFIVASEAVDGTFLRDSDGMVLAAGNIGYVIVFIRIELLYTRRVVHVEL